MRIGSQGQAPHMFILCTGASLVASKGQAAIRQLAAATVPASSAAAQSSAAFSAQLRSLQAALEIHTASMGPLQLQQATEGQADAADQAAGVAVAGSGTRRGSLEHVEGVFRTLVKVWEEVKESQRARAEEEAELFKSKQQPGPPRTDEVFPHLNTATQLYATLSQVIGKQKASSSHTQASSLVPQLSGQCWKSQPKLPKGILRWHVALNGLCMHGALEQSCQFLHMPSRQANAKHKVTWRSSRHWRPPMHW